MRPLVSIGNFVFPDPSKYTATTATMVDSGRNVEGYVIGAVIRDDVAKISMTWNYITAQQWADILKKFSIARGGKFVNDVTFYLQDTNTWVTRQMYVNDRVADIFIRNPDGSIRGYAPASLALIEV